MVLYIALFFVPTGEIKVRIPSFSKLSMTSNVIWWLRGATVARLTPDQKAACSNHVGVKQFLSEQLPFQQRQKLILPPMRIELMTFGLQDQRSATEL